MRLRPAARGGAVGGGGSGWDAGGRGGRRYPVVGRRCTERRWRLEAEAVATGRRESEPVEGLLPDLSTSGDLSRGWAVERPGIFSPRILPNRPVYFPGLNLARGLTTRGKGWDPLGIPWNQMRPYGGARGLRATLPQTWDVH